MLNAGVLTLVDGRVKTSADLARSFNGGTPITEDGSLAVINAPPAFFVGGLGYSVDGALCVKEDAPASFVGGLGVNADGQLCIALTEPVATFVAGLPTTPSGLLAIDAGSVDPDRPPVYVPPAAVSRGTVGVPFSFYLKWALTDVGQPPADITYNPGANPPLPPGLTLVGNGTPDCRIEGTPTDIDDNFRDAIATNPSGSISLYFKTLVVQPNILRRAFDGGFSGGFGA
jgi:hypothetical protein